MIGEKVANTNMKELLLLRHAKSSWEDDRLSDYQRPLNQRGLSDAPRMGRLLRRQELVPDLIIASAAVRAATTAELVAEAMGYEGQIRVEEDLYLAEPERYLALLGKLADTYGRVMAVGHNPGMEEMIELLSGHWERMPTAAIAHMQLPILSWAKLTTDVRGALMNVWWPKEVKE